MNPDIQQLKMMAESGDAEAQFQLATYCHSQGDYAACTRWLKSACHKQHIRAMTNLAICYYFGDGVAQSYTEALPLFQKASTLGDVSAKYYVGLSYLNGNGVDQDSRKAFKILYDCADEGMPWAQLSLADCYKDGIGTAVDLFEAVSWYARAAEQGVEEAQKKFQSIYYSTHFTDHEGKQRWFWFEREALKR